MGAFATNWYSVTNIRTLVIPNPPTKLRRTYVPKEWKIVPLRECPLPQAMHLCDTPEKAAAYWNQHIPNNPYFDRDRECFVVIILNTRHRVRGHQFLSMGTMDTILVHPRDVFRLAIVANAAGIVVMHNHPSGETSPSDADVRVTRDLIRAGQILKIELLDHLIMGHSTSHSSLRSLGFFHC